MQQIIFTCETVTPMFLAGADGSTPELRPPSIKGALRFWWRALNAGRFKSIAELKEAEGAIFGDTKKRSRIIIQPIEYDEDNIHIKSYPMLPHNNKAPQNAFAAEENATTEFSITFLLNDVLLGDTFKLQDLENLFVLVCTLGGFGRRSRRGFGAVAITHKDNKPYFMPNSIAEIYKLFPSDLFTLRIPDSFSSNNIEGEITFNLANRVYLPKNEQFPYIKKVEIGTQSVSVMDIIREAHHANATAGKEPYLNSMGGASPRFASPLYVSLLAGNFKPIITTLKETPPKPYLFSEKVQTNYIDKLT